MSWKYYLLIITLLIILFACIPLLFKSNRVVVREWMSGYAGLLAIAAAVIASVPVFQQLDEARLATKNIKIQLIVSAQRSLDEERARVDDIEKISEDAISIPLSQSSATIDKINIWKIKLSNIYQEMTTKTDAPKYLFAARRNLANSSAAFLSAIRDLKEEYIDNKKALEISEAGRALENTCINYDLASHTQIENMHKVVAENEKELLE